MMETKEDGSRIRALLLTGQSNEWHNWKVSSRALQTALLQAGIFAVDTLASPATGESFDGFAPRWGDFDVVVLDYDGDSWPGPVKDGFAKYVREGGGLVIYHSTDNAFADWPEFNEMIGVGGWGGRDESAGPMARWRNGRVELDDSPGLATHPKPFEFRVATRSGDHPVMRGLPDEWLHATDELYSQLRGPAKNLTVLATARADPDEIEGGTGENEPVLMAIEYGEGRVFHTTLGHVHFDRDTPPEAVRCVGFAATLARGAEWAATGEVTQAIPRNFPGRDNIVIG